MKEWTIPALAFPAEAGTHLQLIVIVLQEESARILLFRGADRCIKNYANQTAAEVAVIADNVHISELINNFKSSDVGKPEAVLLSIFCCVFCVTIF